MERFGRCLNVDPQCTVEANEGAKGQRHFFMFKVVDWKTAQRKSGVLCFVWWTFISPRKKVRGGGFIGVLQQRPGSQKVKRLLLMKENQISQGNEFSAFLCMGRCRSLDSLKSFLWYALCLGSVSCLFSSWVPLGCTIGGDYSGWGLGSQQPIFLLPGPLRAHCGGGQSSLMAIASFVYW